MTEHLRQSIHEKILELARELGNDATKLSDDEDIPSTGFLDSAAIMGLILWIEAEYNLAIPQEDLTLENLGTIAAIEAYVKSHAGMMN